MRIRQAKTKVTINIYLYGQYISFSLDHSNKHEGGGLQLKWKDLLQLMEAKRNFEKKQDKTVVHWVVSKDEQRVRLTTVSKSSSKEIGNYIFNISEFIEEYK